MHQRALDGAPSLCVLGAHHDQVNWNAHRSQGFAQSHELLTTAPQVGLDHQKIKV
jgi:hypothetical protein